MRDGARATALSPAGHEAFVNDALAKLSGAGKAEPPKTADGWFASLAKGAGAMTDRGVRGVANGVVDTAALPVSLNSLNRGLLSWALQKTGAPAGAADLMAQSATPIAHLEPVAGAHALRGYLDAGNNAVADTLGVERPRVEADGPAERVVERVGEMLGGAILPAGAAVNAGQKIGVEGARAGNWFMRNFIEPAAVDPARYLAKEAGAAAAAGTGAGLTNEAVRGSGGQPGFWSDFLGGIGGLGVYGVGNIMARTAGDIGRAVLRSPQYTDEIVRQSAAGKIAQSMGAEANAHGVVDTAPLVDWINRGRRVDIPGFSESLGDRTGLPNVQALEYGRSGLDEAGKFAERRASNAAAIDAAMQRNAPSESALSGTLRQELDLERTRRLGDASAAAQAAQAEADAVAQRLQSVLPAEARGADIRAALEGASADAKKIVDDAWTKFRANGDKIDVAPLADRFDSVTNRLAQVEQQKFAPAEAAVPRRLADKAGEAPYSQIMNATPEASVPLREVTGIRSALTDAQRVAATAGKANEARVIGQYIDALDQHVGDVMPAAARGDYEAARAVTKDFHDRFSRPQTAVAQTLDKREGMYAQPDSGVAGRFLQEDNGRLSDFRALMDEAGADPRVKTALRDQVLSDVQARGLLDKPEALDAHLGRYSTVLKEFPDLQKELGGAAGVRRALSDAQTAEKTLVSDLGNEAKPGRSTVGQYLRFGDENAEKAMRGVMNSADPRKSVDDLLTFAGDTPASRESAKRIYWDIMQKDARAGGATTKTSDGAQPWNPARLKAFVDDPAKAAVAERIYADNPEHLTNIRQIAEAIQNVDTRAAGKAVNASGTAQSRRAVLTPESLQSRFYAYKRGQVGIPYLATSIAATLARNSIKKAQTDAIGRLMDEALLNPDVAATLLKENNPANRAALAKSAKGWTAGEIAHVTAERDPVVDYATGK